MDRDGGWWWGVIWKGSGFCTGESPIAMISEGKSQNLAMFIVESFFFDQVEKKERKKKKKKKKGIFLSVTRKEEKRKTKVDLHLKLVLNAPFHLLDIFDLCSPIFVANWTYLIRVNICSFLAIA